MSSEMCSLWSSGQQLGVRCLAQGSHLSRGHFLPEPGFEPTTLGYLRVSSPTLYPLSHDCPLRLMKQCVLLLLFYKERENIIVNI